MPLFIHCEAGGGTIDLCNVVDTAYCDREAVYHVYHEHQVTVEAVFTIMECVREANRTGGCCTSSEMQRCIVQKHHLSITVRILRSVLSSMSYCTLSGCRCSCPGR